MDWSRNYTILPNQMENPTFGVVSIVKQENYAPQNIAMTSDSQVISQADISNGLHHIDDLSSPSRRDLDIYNAVKEDELKEKPLPDHLKEGLDIVIVGINPSLASAHAGHHYAGPGNHFWTCLSQAGLVPMSVTCHDDSRMLDYGIGFTNVCTRPTKGAAELTRKEMKAGAAIMLEKMRKYKPKIAVFNGKGIYEAYVGHKNFSMGRQPNSLDGTDTLVFVMPSSSARCAQLPRAEDKLPFFHALRKLRDFVRGHLTELADSEVVFTDYTEFRVTQPDPKSLRKAERRRKRKAEAAAAAAVAVAGSSGAAATVSPAHPITVSAANVMGSSTTTSGSTTLPAGVASATVAGTVSGQLQLTAINGSNSKRRKVPSGTPLSNPCASQIHQPGAMAFAMQGVAAIADPQLVAQQQLQFQQQQQTYLIQQQQQYHQQQQFIHSLQSQHQQPQQQQTAGIQSHGQALTAAAQPMIVSGAQFMSAGPVVTLSMTPGTAGPAAAAAIPMHGGVPGAATALSTGCYATHQLQFSTGPTVTTGPPAAAQQFFISPQATAGAGGQTLLHWSAAPVGTSSATMHFPQTTAQPQQQHQQSQQGQPIAWQTVYTPGHQQPQQQQTQQQHPQQVTASTNHLLQHSTVQQQAQSQPQQQLISQSGLQLATQQPGQQLLFAAATSQHPVVSLQTAMGAGTATAYPQQIYVAQGPTGVPNPTGTSYHLLPVNCPSSHFTNLLLSDQQQQHVPQSAQQLPSGSQCPGVAAIAPQLQQRGQLQIQHQQQIHPSQPQHIQPYSQQQIQTTGAQTAQQQQQQLHAYLQTNAHQPLTDLANSTPCSAAQFITLAPGAPLKVMAVGPNGQLIQTVPQFLPAATATAPIGMTLGQTGFSMPVSASSAALPTATVHQQRRQAAAGGATVANGGHLATNGHRPAGVTAVAAPTALFTGPSGIPLVQSAAGEDLLTVTHSGGGAGGLPVGVGDEKLVYTAL